LSGDSSGGGEILGEQAGESNLHCQLGKSVALQRGYLRVYCLAVRE
jgi:hypothetical protein